MSQKYPIGIQSFEKLREGNFLYIDKTPYLHNLVNSAGYFYLAQEDSASRCLSIR